MEPHAVSFQVRCDRPLGVTVAIATDQGHGRSETLDCLENCRCANITEVPDLIGAGRERFQIRGQFVMGVGHDEDAERRRHFELSHADALCKA